MKSGNCPKCRSTAIYGDGHNIYGQRNWLALDFWRGANVENYICLDCGYLENYVLPDQIEKWGQLIREKWRKVKQA